MNEYDKALMEIRLSDAERRRLVEGDWCRICGAAGGVTELHHAVFRSQGGKKGPLVRLCSQCHQYVHMRMLWLFEKEGRIAFAFGHGPIERIRGTRRYYFVTNAGCGADGDVEAEAALYDCIEDEEA